MIRTFEEFKANPTFPVCWVRDDENDSWDKRFYTFSIEGESYSNYTFDNEGHQTYYKYITFSDPYAKKDLSPDSFIGLNWGQIRFRSKSSGQIQGLGALLKEKVYLSYCGFISWKTLREHWEWSTDGGETWKETSE